MTGCLGVTLGYHRLLTHRSFQCPRLITYFLTVAGALAGQGGPISWVANHRKHHQFSDRKGDPHSPKEGFFWSHMGWLFKRSEMDIPENYKKYAPDLDRDPFLRFLDRAHPKLLILLAIGLYLWGGLPFLVWGISVRMVFLYHSTWFVNSATHTWGYQSFKTNDDSRNLWWVSLLAFGEGWHNNHHAFQSSARHGLRWWEFDLTYLIIRTLSFFGLAKQIKTASSS
jgi:stearoyl-CoA desaturase (delta-9 desaturase)